MRGCAHKCPTAGNGPYQYPCTYTGRAGRFAPRAVLVGPSNTLDGVSIQPARSQVDAAGTNLYCLNNNRNLNTDVAGGTHLALQI